MAEEYEFQVLGDRGNNDRTWVTVEGLLIGDNMVIGIHPALISDGKGGFDYHDRHYTVTHVPTGLRLVPVAGLSKRKATAIAEKLVELGFGDVGSASADTASRQLQALGAPEIVRALREIAMGTVGSRRSDKEAVEAIRRYRGSGRGSKKPRTVREILYGSENSPLRKSELDLMRVISNLTKRGTLNRYAFVGENTSRVVESLRVKGMIEPDVLDDCWVLTPKGSRAIGRKHITRAQRCAILRKKGQEVPSECAPRKRKSQKKKAAPKPKQKKKKKSSGKKKKADKGFDLLDAVADL